MADRAEPKFTEAIGSLVAFEPVKPYERLPPQEGNGRTQLRQFTDKTGLYYILEEGRIIYIRACYANLYKAAIRHFQKGRRSYSERLCKGVPYTVGVFVCDAALAVQLERTLIAKFAPRDNKPSDIPVDNHLLETLQIALRKQFAGRRSPTLRLFCGEHCRKSNFRR